MNAIPLAGLNAHRVAGIERGEARLVLRAATLRGDGEVDAASWNQLHMDDGG